jgi:hypothetical protein
MAPGDERGGDRGPGGPTEDLLDSWKDIASYLQRDVRTATLGNR